MARPGYAAAAPGMIVTDRGGSGIAPGGCARGVAVDQTYLLILAVAAIVAIGAVLIIRDRMRRDDRETTPVDSPYATSTEGMKVCPRCGMGNLWTDRTCISCGSALKG